MVKPHVESLYDCQGPCYEPYETLPLARISHSVTCSEKHGASGETSSYWSCEYNVCPRSAEHWLVCGGTCGQSFPPKRVNLGQGNFRYEADSPHYKKCSESVYSFLNPNATCGEKYYTCQYSTCPVSNTHWSSSNPIVTPPPTPTPPSPTYHACGVHETSVSGDHSLQASCSSTDSNGNYCTVTSFYACDSHTHSYPSPTPTPTTVACGGASWTGCSGAASRTEHHVPSCANCGNAYWTCSEYASRHTTTYTCQRTGCGASFTRCQNGPGKCVNGGYHWLDY